MRSEVRASPEAEHTVWWLLLCRAVEQRVRAALAAREGEPKRTFDCSWPHCGCDRTGVDSPPCRAEHANERAAAPAAREGEPVYGIFDPDYARVFTKARCIAWSEGYALAVHGSFTRDLDLLAVPWADHACDAEHLVDRIADACGLKPNGHPPGDKPHGRRAWTLLFPEFGDPRFIDLSVFAAPPAPAQPVDLDRQVRDISAGIGLPPADDPTVPDPFLDCECGRRWAFDTRGWHAIAPTQPASAEQATVQPTTLQNAIAWGRLYDRAQALCAEIGYAGSVSTDDDEVELLMDALHAIDGGEWMPGLLPAVAAPAPSAEQQPVANRDTPALHEAVDILRKLLTHGWAEDCQECAIGQSSAWADAKALIARVDAARRDGGE